MATIKSYTDLEQSKKLAEILPIESADMYWDYDVRKHEFYPMVMDELFDDTCIRAWSLTALLGILPNENMLVKTTDGEYYCLAKDVMTKHYDNPVDACVAMIERLHELNLL